MLLSAFGRPRAAGIIALTLAEGDRLVSTVVTSGDDVILPPAMMAKPVVSAKVMFVQPVVPPPVCAGIASPMVPRWSVWSAVRRPRHPLDL